MSEINKLTAVNSVTGSDQVPIYSSSNGDARKVSMTNLRTFMTNGIASDTHAATNKITPVDADELPISDSAASFALKKLNFGNLKTWIKAIFSPASGNLLIGSAPNYSITTTTILTASNKKAVGIISGTSYTITLPLANTVMSGDWMEFKCTASGDVTIQRQSTDTIGMSSATVTSMIMKNGDTLTLVSNGSNQWVALNAFIQSGTGAVARAQNSKLRDTISTSDYDTLANARAAAGFVKDVVNPTTGITYLKHSETFDLAANVLSVGNYWKPTASVNIPDGKQLNLFRNDATVNVVGNTSSGSAFAVHNSNITVTGSQGAVKADHYLFIGNISTASDVTAKALYGRVTALSGCTGDIVGLVGRIQLDTGSNVNSAHCMQIGPAGDLAKVTTSVIWVSHESGQGLAQFGVLSDNNIGYTVAMIRGVAGGGGDFLKWQASGGGAATFSVNDAGNIFTNTKLTVGLYTELTDGFLTRTASAGALTVAAGATGTLYLGTGTNFPLSITASIVSVDNANGRRLNFTGAGSATVGAAGTAAALPANPLGYVIMRVNNADVKIPYYNT